MKFDRALKAKIDAAIESDQGKLYRERLQVNLPLFGDIYRERDQPYEMPKLRVSSIGEKCTRKIWYRLRAAKGEKIPARILRLFNRGHLEEPRFVSMLETVGVKVTHNSDKLSFVSNSLGGTADGLGENIPGYEGQTLLLEYKTMSKDAFSNWKKNGVALFNDNYYVQLQFYMMGMRVKQALFMGCCKNDDDFEIEVVEFRPEVVHQYYERGQKVLACDTPPVRINESPLWWECKFCNFQGICHGTDASDVNCRTCQHVAYSDGSWNCTLKQQNGLSEKLQSTGCQNHVHMPELAQR